MASTIDQIRREFPYAGDAIIRAQSVINQTPADARREWNGILLTRDETPAAPIASTVLFALELGGKLLCKRPASLRHPYGSINAGTWGTAIAFTDVAAVIAFSTVHSGNRHVQAATMIPLTPAELIARKEHTVHLIVDGEGIDIRTGNALAYAALTPAERKTGYGYDIANGNRRVA